jgi:hypothetical protein
LWLPWGQGPVPLKIFILSDSSGHNFHFDCQGSPSYKPRRGWELH